MDLIPQGGVSARSKLRWPNRIVFPKELRDAIPEYGSSALVFDSVIESHSNASTPISGKLDGKFALLAHLDAGTTRALRTVLN
ncbi:MAG TPA: hypothetical protein VM120_07580 [Bryobacteraceae bacterium]|nr:hypothetical protein [Bryobacteraceae bacterium]